MFEAFITQAPAELPVAPEFPLAVVAETSVSPTATVAVGPGLSLDFESGKVTKLAKEMTPGEDPRYHKIYEFEETVDLTGADEIIVTARNGESAWAGDEYIEHSGSREETLRVAIERGELPEGSTVEALDSICNYIVVKTMVQDVLTEIGRIYCVEDFSGDVSTGRFNLTDFYAGVGKTLTPSERTSIKLTIEEYAIRWGSLEEDIDVVPAELETPATTTTTTTSTTTTTTLVEVVPPTVPEERGDEHMPTTTVPTEISTQTPTEREDYDQPVDQLAYTGGDKATEGVVGFTLLLGGIAISLMNWRDKRRAKLEKAVIDLTEK